MRMEACTGTGTGPGSQPNACTPHSHQPFAPLARACCENLATPPPTPLPSVPLVAAQDCMSLWDINAILTSSTHVTSEHYQDHRAYSRQLCRRCRHGRLTLHCATVARLTCKYRPEACKQRIVHDDCCACHHCQRPHNHLGGNMNSHSFVTTAPICDAHSNGAQRTIAQHLGALQ